MYNTIDMQGAQLLYYALGELVYAVAKSDGVVQKSEQDELNRIVKEELAALNLSIDTTKIMVEILQEEDTEFETVYQWALKAFRKSQYYLTPELKDKFVKIIERVAAANPPITNEEQELILRFKRDMEELST